MTPDASSSSSSNDHGLDERGLPPRYPFKPDLEVAPREARRWLRESPKDTIILDVRTAAEWHTSHVPGSIHVPLDQLADRCESIPFDRVSRVAVMCHHGVRSMKATLFLRERGIDHAISVAGGIDLWSIAADPCVARYERDASGCRIIQG